MTSNEWALVNRKKPFTGSEDHVIPLDDFRDHELSAQCWCKPVEDEDYTELYMHNAMDGREAYENGERMPS